MDEQERSRFLSHSNYCHFADGETEARSCVMIIGSRRTVAITILFLDAQGYILEAGYTKETPPA